jgi:hypothetical protein
MKNFYTAPAVEIAEIESEGVFADSGAQSCSMSGIGFETATVSSTEEDW